MAKDKRDKGDKGQEPGDEDEYDRGKSGLLPPLRKEDLEKMRKKTAELTEKYNKLRGRGRTEPEDGGNKHHHMPGEVGIGGRDGMRRTARAEHAAGLHRSSRSEGDIPFG